MNEKHESEDEKMV